MVDPNDTPVTLKDAGDVERILVSGDPDQIKSMFRSFGQIKNRGYAEMVCADFFEDPDPEMRLAVIIALAQVAEQHCTLDDLLSVPFLERELSRSKEGQPGSIDKGCLNRLLTDILCYTGLTIEGVIGCYEPTSWAYVGRDITPDCFSDDFLHDLSKQPWDYSKMSPCGSMLDNIDGVVTWYICPDCQSATQT